MKLPTPPPREESENILPLVNVVFLLIIFFMLTGAFASPELFKVDPPDSASENPTRIEKAVILLNADGRLAYGDREVNDQELQDLIARRMVESGRQEPIKLKADAKVETDRLIEVMQRLKEAGVEQLTLLTLPPESR